MQIKDRVVTAVCQEDFRKPDYFEDLLRTLTPLTDPNHNETGIEVYNISDLFPFSLQPYKQGGAHLLFALTKILSDHVSKVQVYPGREKEFS